MNFKMLCALVLLTACSGSVSDLPDFDEQQWKEDKNGCKGLRDAMKADFDRVRPHLMGLSERNVIVLLGRADRTELKERNEKKLIYLYAGVPCDSDKPSPVNEAYFELKLNAVNLVKEINEVY